jgi:hypothetical protein
MTSDVAAIHLVAAMVDSGRTVPEIVNDSIANNHFLVDFR